MGSIPVSPTMSYHSALDNGVQIKNRQDQVLNNAGGYVFSVDELDMLKRFLVLGTFDTYYVTKDTLTKEHIENIYRMLNTKEKAIEALEIVKEFSYNGRVIKNEPSIVVLAACFSHQDIEVKRKAAEVFKYVIRTGYHLFQFMEYLKRFRKFGRLIKRTISDWYLSKTPKELSYQVVKYQARITNEGDPSSRWSHKDIIKIVHPKAESHEINSIFRYVLYGTMDESLKDTYIYAYENVKKAENIDDIVHLIQKYNLTWEFVPSNHLWSRDVWKALLPNLPYTALLRNLARLTSLNILDDELLHLVSLKLTDGEYIRKSRVSPFALLLAWLVYKNGKGIKSDSIWHPIPQIVDSLEIAFEKSFENTERELDNKKILIAIDVSGSMCGRLSEAPISIIEAAALLAWVLLRLERNADIEVIGVSTRISHPSINSDSKMGYVMEEIMRYAGGGTDLSLPFRHALNVKKYYDAIVVLTDNETWHGPHPYQLLDYYKNSINKNVKTILVDMVPNSYTIVPLDKNNLNIVGFDSSMFDIIRKFIALE
ncbi:TROVE domain-containing protein [Candidatus Dojkabacteria bacterium]|uniref:TROVE domain-containing protein n=1 Tax=Candidatus Dojkabacteria bacterium TaxID=2099670 RepID=A0A3M0Z0Y1_9BACT|nr:MAG: TROVE domain-containing protein [Candidatus Dojkabacteria bacterium]